MALIREGSALRTHGDLLAKPADLFFAHRQLIRIKNQRRKRAWVFMPKSLSSALLGLQSPAFQYPRHTGS